MINLNEAWELPEEGELVRVTSRVNHDGERLECLHTGFVQMVANVNVTYPAIILFDICSGLSEYLMCPEYTVGTNPLQKD